MANIIQLSRMLGMDISAVLEHAGNLKHHIRLDGIEARTLLGDGEIKELLEHIHKHLFVMIEQLGIGLEGIGQYNTNSFELL